MRSRHPKKATTSLIFLLLLAALTGTSADSGFRLYGRLVRSTGAPAAGVTVRFSGGIAAVVTDSQGRYSVAAPQDGAEYTLTPASTNFAFQPASARVCLSGEDVEVNFTAVPEVAQSPSPVAIPVSGNPAAGSVTGEISIAGEIDIYYFEVPADQAGLWYFWTSLGTLRDSKLILARDATTTSFITGNDNCGNTGCSLDHAPAHSRVNYTLSGGTRYYLRVSGSNGATGSYTVKLQARARVAAPAFGLPGDTYGAPVYVGMSCATRGATIRYTIDGTDPSPSSPPYTTYVPITGLTTLRARAFKAGMEPSAVTSAVYAVRTPVRLELAGAPSSGMDTKTLSPGIADIYYFDVSVDRGGLWHLWTSLETLRDSSLKLYADPACLRPLMANDNCGTSLCSLDHAIPHSRLNATLTGDHRYYLKVSGPGGASGSYTVHGRAYAPVATPVFSPAPGSYAGNVTVNLTCATTGASLRYTINGSTPTVTSPLWPGGTAFTQNVTLKVRAFQAGLPPSATVTGAYTITAPSGEWPSFEMVGFNDQWPYAGPRWLDIGDFPYSATFRANNSAALGKITVRYNPNPAGPYLVGEIKAEGLKPNFCYQLKLVGKPGTPAGGGLWGAGADTLANERILRAGRWWNYKTEDTIFTTTDEKGVLASADYQQGWVAGYLYFQHFVTDARGNTDPNGDGMADFIPFAANRSYHVTWKTGQISFPSFPTPVTHNFTRLPEYAYGTVPAGDAQDETQLWTEPEPDDPVAVTFPVGTYDVVLMITEESFHSSGIGGCWLTTRVSDWPAVNSPLTGEFWVTGSGHRVVFTVR